MTDLEQLLEKVKGGDSQGIPLPSGIVHLFGTSKNAGLVVSSYYGSTDAAIALMEAVLPGWEADIYTGGSVTLFKVLRVNGFDADADNPARALLIAILEALIEKGGE